MPAGRILGLDIARGFAILGMMAAHILRPEGESFYDGRSAALFAVLAGVSLGLMTGGSTPLPAGERPRARVSIIIRGLLLIAVGLTLGRLLVPVAVILDTYGFLFLVITPLLFAPRWILGTLAVAAAVCGPALVGILSRATVDGGPLPVDPDTALAVPLAWLIGYYPAPVWIAYLLVGLLLARSNIRRMRSQVVSMIAGAASALAGYGIPLALGSPVEAHEDSLAEVLGAGGLAVLIVGLLAWLSTNAPTLLRRGLLIAWPLAAAGAMALTIYAGHIFVIAIARQLGSVDGLDTRAWMNGAFLTWLALGSVVFAVLWRIRFSQGPVEYALSVISLRRPGIRAGRNA
jgi:uncharacterized membrane protein YeiB